jgi:hypothetical protein
VLEVLTQMLVVGHTTCVTPPAHGIKTA